MGSVVKVKIAEKHGFQSKAIQSFTLCVLNSREHTMISLPQAQLGQYPWALCTSDTAVMPRSITPAS